MLAICGQPEGCPLLASLAYQLLDAHYAAASPARAWALGLSQINGHRPHLAPHADPWRAAEIGGELIERATRRWGKPAFGIDRTTVDGAEVAVEERVVLERPFCKLLHFERDVTRDDPRLLVVAPMSGHFATLLRGTVADLLPEHEVYVTDWANARDVPLREGSFDHDGYIDYLLDFIRLLGPEVHVMGVCQPAVPVLAAVSLLAAADDPCTPRSMILMGGAIDTRESPTAVNRFAKAHSLDWFRRTMIASVPPWYAGAWRPVYPGFLQLWAYMSMNGGRHTEAYWQFIDDLVWGNKDGARRHRRFYDEYLSVMDLTAEFYLQTVQTVFQDDDLPLGRFVSRGRLVEPDAISRTALMTIEGGHDDITGAGQTDAAHGLCPNIPAARRARHLEPGVGHYGLFNGHGWREDIRPRIAEFVRANRGASLQRSSGH